MQLTCPACGARYALDEDAIPAEGRMVRCSNCRAEWRAGGRAARMAPPAREVVPPPFPARQPAPAMQRAPERAAPRSPASPSPASPSPAPPPPAPVRSEALAASLEEPRGGGRGGFMAGFAVISLLALLAVAVYARHADVATAVPQLAEPLERYVALVDRARDALADAVAELR